ncbi:MAG: protein kinase [Rubripirellula sp.]
MSDDITIDGDSTERSSDDSPRMIGRYKVRDVLGQGGFGVVYLAHDDRLDRFVAVKVPHRSRALTIEKAEPYLREARTVASLDHPHIVPVYDVDSTPEFPIFVVSKYVQGSTLTQSLKQRRLHHTEVARLIISMAEALQEAHKHGIVHRDIKPSNILIDSEEKPHVVDFGLALRDDDSVSRLRQAGTPAYMSPEQARGEGHRVDGRSDIFSLGVVMYQLLVGRRPFRGENKAELYDQIISLEPSPLRQFDETIPRELTRICYKTLSKRARDRYPSAHDLAEDLRHFLLDRTNDTDSTAALLPVSGAENSVSVSGSQTPVASTPVGAREASTSGDQQIAVVPKGLRSFDSRDSDFFLTLLPGPKDRYGTPDNIRFWINQVEQSDPERSFSVGLMYGPSGCGKSSIVNSGLLPRLSEDVIRFSLEATANDTEARLLNGLRKHCGGLDRNLPLQDAMSSVRRGAGLPAGKKLLIVIDQFEQWLNAWDGERNSPMARALRQCDASRLQCIVLVRDDFWLAASRLMAEIEVDLVPGVNTALVDLFDRTHARKVLTLYGIAYDRVPAAISEMSSVQERFLDDAIDLLADDGKIVPVQLAIFADMVKDKAWTRETLTQVGGFEGIGIAFLQEKFSARSPREYRRHEVGARAVLNALLPQHDEDLKGNLRSETELREIAGYAQGDEQFHQLIRVLDADLRVITPSDPLGDLEESSLPSAAGEMSESWSSSAERYYQLTHDFLVPSLRGWLTQKQRETLRGRTFLQLAEATQYWKAKPETRRLPSLLEWVRFSFLTRSARRTPSQAAMMRVASKRHLVRLCVAAVFTCAMLWAGLEGYGRLQASKFALQLRTAASSRVPEVIDHYAPFLRWSDGPLRQLMDDPAADDKAKLHARLALMRSDPSQVPYLADRMLETDLLTASVILGELYDRRGALIETLWEQVESQETSSPKALRALVALASFTETSSPIQQSGPWQENLELVVDRIIEGVDGTHVDDDRNRLAEAFLPVRDHLLDSLTDEFQSDVVDRREAASYLLERLSADRPEVLTRLILHADDTQYPVFHGLAEKHKQAVVPELRRALVGGLNAEDDERRVRQLCNAATSLILMDSEPELVWKLSEELLSEADDPRATTRMIHSLSARGVPAKSIADRLIHATDDLIARPLLLALGGYDPSDLEPEQGALVVERALAMMTDLTSAGNHTYALWLLNRWGFEEQASAALQVIDPHRIDADHAWRLGVNDHLFVRVDARSAPAIQHAFEISARENSVRQHLTAFPHKYINEEVSPTSECPANVIQWFEALRYCQWLNEQDRIPEEEWCFKPIESKEEEDLISIGKLRVEIDIEKTGYRLPTVAEWRYACMAGSACRMHFGDSFEYFTHYGWLGANSGGQTQPVGTMKPNRWGLFDCYGNVREWCVDEFDARHDALIIGAGYGHFTATARLNTTGEAPERAPPDQGRNMNGMRVVRTIKLN